jgi:redox-sensitive bicupin YhaK (pirin superfamily)
MHCPFEGAVTLGEGEEARPLESQEMAVLGGGELLQLRAGNKPARLIVVAGRPLREPVMRHGPFVMNTKCRPSSIFRKAASEHPARLPRRCSISPLRIPQGNSP